MNDKKYEASKFLPIGSIVLLKEATKKMMIIGFSVIAEEEKEKVYDYLGCVYPEGVMNSTRNLLFNHDQIDKVIAYGYFDDEETNFKQKLDVVREKLNIKEKKDN